MGVGDYKSPGFNRSNLFLRRISNPPGRQVANKIESEREKAVAYHDTVAPKMEEIRYQIDKLELLVADELWTLPKYRELLFIR